MKKIPLIILASITLASCANDAYRCGVPGTDSEFACSKAGDVYNAKVLGKKQKNKDKKDSHGFTIRESDGARILTQPDILDRQLHNFEGSVQSSGKGSPLLVRPITRDPVYRSIYLPGETLITNGGKPMRVMPRVLVVEQIPGGFIDGPLDGALTSPIQYRIPIKSDFQKTKTKKKVK